MQTTNENVMELARNYILNGNEIPYEFFVTYFPDETKLYTELGEEEFKKSLENYDHNSEEYNRAQEFLSCCHLNAMCQLHLYDDNMRNLDTMYVDYEDTHITYPTSGVKK